VWKDSTAEFKPPHPSGRGADGPGACDELVILIGALNPDKGLAGAPAEVLTFFCEEHAAQTRWFTRFLREEEELAH
jgi:hypothetical protein